MSKRVASSPFALGETVTEDEPPTKKSHRDETPTATIGTIVATTVRINQPRIDINSFHIICDYLTLSELATTIGRINHSWLHLLSSYRPSADHPFRREMKVPSGEDENLTPIGCHSEVRKERQWWMQQQNLIGLSTAAPFYRRLISTMILESRPHGDVYHSTVPSTILSPSSLQLLSNKEAFPNLRTLYCTFSGLMEYQRMNHRWEDFLSPIESSLCSLDQWMEGQVEYYRNFQDLAVFPPYEHFSSDELRLQDLASINPDTGRHRFDWSLPSQLHTLDCVVEYISQWDEDVSGLIDFFCRIGECRSLRRLSIHFEYPYIDESPALLRAILQSLSKLVDLIELELICFNCYHFFWPFDDESSDFEQLRSFYLSFPHMTALRPSLKKPLDERLYALLAPPFPLHQLRCRPNIKSSDFRKTTRSWMDQDNNESESTAVNHPLTYMTGLREFVGLIESPTTDLFMSLTHLTHLEAYSLKPNIWNGHLIRSLSHCQLLQTLIIRLRRDPPVFSTNPITEDGLGRLFSSLQQLDHLLIEVNHEHEFFIQSIGPRYAPHLKSTLKTLELFCGFPSLMDLQHLTNLRRLRLNSFTATKDEFIHVLDSFHSLTHCDLTPDETIPDEIFFEWLMSTHVIHQLREFEYCGRDVSDETANIPDSFFPKCRALEWFRCRKKVERLAIMTGLKSLWVNGLKDHVIDADLLVSSLQQSLPRLRSFRLIEIPNLDDSTVSSLLTLFSSSLRELRLSKLPLLTNLSNVSTHCQQLTELSLNGLPRLHTFSSESKFDSGGTPTIAIDEFKSLQLLSIMDCPSLPESAYQIITTMKRLASLELDPSLVESIIKSDDTALSATSSISENPLYQLRPEVCMLNLSCPPRFLTVDLREICIQRHPFWVERSSW